MRADTRVDTLRPLLSLQTVWETLGISRAHLYRVLAGGALPSVRIGARRLVHSSDLQAYIDSLRT